MDMPPSFQHGVDDGSGESRRASQARRSMPPEGVGGADGTHRTSIAGRHTSRNRTLAAGLLCVLVGLLLSTLPHLQSWIRLGEPIWVADEDELGLYLPVAAQASVHHPFRLADPVVSDGPTAYQWLQLGLLAWGRAWWASCGASSQD